VIADFGVTAGELTFGSRGSPQAALARQAAMYLCHVGFALSFEAIGKLFCRDRTTVAHACRVIEERREDIWFDCRMATLEQACGAARSARAVP
jgi:chromosomal replication initiation ATPase DnaA